MVLGSCTKQYSCKCTTTLSAPGYYPETNETIEPLKKNITKKKAQQTCDHTAKQMSDHVDELYVDWVEVNTKCELKDY